MLSFLTNSLVIKHLFLFAPSKPNGQEDTPETPPRVPVCVHVRARACVCVSPIIFLLLVVVCLVTQQHPGDLEESLFNPGPLTATVLFG